eukprot:3566223-Rhodomonas_salina.1
MKRRIKSESSGKLKRETVRAYTRLESTADWRVLLREQVRNEFRNTRRTMRRNRECPVLYPLEPTLPRVAARGHIRSWVLHTMRDGKRCSELLRIRQYKRRN